MSKVDRGWLLEDDPRWYHASVNGADVQVSDGLLEEVVEHLTDAGIVGLRECPMVDFAPGVIVDEYGYYHACRHRLYYGALNGMRLTILVSPIRKRYLTYDQFSCKNESCVMFIE